MDQDKLYWSIEKLKNWPKNPRGIKKDDFERLKRQIQWVLSKKPDSFGQYKPLLVSDCEFEYIFENKETKTKEKKIAPIGTVLGGNMRLKAFEELGISNIWVSLVSPINEAEATKYALSDNDRAGYYIEDRLVELIQEHGIEIGLEDYKIDLGEAFSLTDLLNKFSPELEEDEPPLVDEGEPVSKYGEIYELGNHRLMCGDATKIDDVEKLMSGQKVDMVFTDPPYNVNWDYRGKFKERGLKPIFNDNLKEDEWDNFCNNFISNMLAVMEEGAVYYMCSGWHSLSMFEKHLFLNKAKQRQLIIWAKNQFVMGKQSTDYHRQHEQLWYGWKEGAAHHWYGGHKESDLWEIKKVHNLSMIHSTEKPVALSFKAIKNSSKQGDIILDLFGGSGSILIACEQLNRLCYMLELDPRYCDVIRKRYAKFTEKGSKL